MERLSKCTRLNELDEFLSKVQVDKSSWGRKFTFTNDKWEKNTYTMNQIVYRFQCCSQKSIGNAALRNKISNRLTFLNNAVNTHLFETEPGIFFKIRAFFGNEWFRLTHSGFIKEKSKVWNGRTDLTVDNINDYNLKGITHLNALLFTGSKKYSDLYKDVKEILDNGADPFVTNNNTNMDSSNLAFQEAEKGNNTALEVLLELVKVKDLKTIISSNYKSSLTKETKLIIVEIIHRRFEDCAEIMSSFGLNKADFFSVYNEYLQSRIIPINNSIKCEDSNL